MLVCDCAVMSAEQMAAAMALTQPQLSQEAVQELLVLQVRLEGITKRMATVAQDALAREEVSQGQHTERPWDWDGCGTPLAFRASRLAVSWGLTARRAVWWQNPDKSPSPPPIYNSNGKRTNTWEVRPTAPTRSSRLCSHRAILPLL
jgi:hypothetical protein